MTNRRAAGNQDDGKTQDTHPHMSILGQGDGVYRVDPYDAASDLMLDNWPSKGIRDEVAMALCGMLARGGWDADRIDMFVCTVAQMAGDEEWKQRGKGKRTLAQLVAGKRVTGGRRLAELLGPNGKAIVAKLGTWLGLGAHGTHPTHRAHDGTHPEQGDHSSAMIALLERQEDEPGRRTLWSSAASENSVPTEITRVEALIPAAEVTPTRAQPLFGGRLYFGKLALCDGDPGLGKTLVALDLAARLSAGRAMSDGSQTEGAGNVLYFSAEDDPADTLRPRLEAAGGDLRRVYFVTTARLLPPEASEPVTRLPTFRDVSLLAHYIAQTQARLVILDPFMAYLDANANAFRDQDVRSILAPLAVLAEQAQAALLFIRHLNKSGGARALYRGGGSIGIIGAVRAAWLIGRDPNDAQCQVLASTKNNLGALPPSLAYRIVSAEGQAPVVQWMGLSAHTADMLVAGPEPRADTLEAAMALLTMLLQAAPMPETEVRAYMEEHGISQATLRRAKAGLGICSDKRGGHEGREGAQWWWSLPSTETTIP